MRIERSELVNVSFGIVNISAWPYSLYIEYDCCVRVEIGSHFLRVTRYDIESHDFTDVVLHLNAIDLEEPKVVEVANVVIMSYGTNDVYLKYKNVRIRVNVLIDSYQVSPYTIQERD